MTTQIGADGKRHAIESLGGISADRRRLVYVHGTPAAGQVPTWNATSGQLEWASGGSSAVLGAQQVGGLATGLVTGTQVNWTSSGLAATGDSLLDFTAPTAPAVILEGVYSVVAQGGPDSGARPGKSQQIQLTLNSSGPGGGRTVYDTTPLDFTAPIGWASFTWYMEAGDAIFVIVQHDIGAATDYDLNLYVQKVA